MSVRLLQGQFVNEYVGELIDEEESKRRLEKYHADNCATFYMLTLDTNRLVLSLPADVCCDFVWSVVRRDNKRQRY